MKNLWEFDIRFTDQTLVDTEGLYDRVRTVMHEAARVKINVVRNGVWTTILSEDSSFSEEWCIKSTVHIVSQFGECMMVLDFYHDGSIYIVSYHPSSESEYNPDIRCLSMWCQQAGWKVPQPVEALIRERLYFWRNMWETTLINSDYLEERYGTRHTEDMRTANVERMEDMAEEENEEEQEEPEQEAAEDE